MEAECAVIGMSQSNATINREGYITTAFSSVNGMVHINERDPMS